MEIDLERKTGEPFEDWVERLLKILEGKGAVAEDMRLATMLINAIPQLLKTIKRLKGV